MRKEKRICVFIGEALKSLAPPKLKSRYFADSSSFFEALINGELHPAEIVLFHHFPSTESLNGFIERVSTSAPQLMLVTPLVAHFSEAFRAQEDVPLNEFDYVFFSDPNPDHIRALMDYLVARKKSELDRNSLLLINRAILRDLLEKQNVDALYSLPNSAQLYFGVDKYGIFQTIGDEVLSILGFSRDEIIGHHFLELASRDEYMQLKRVFTERRTGSRRAKEITVNFRTKDGRREEFLIDAQGVHVPSVEEWPQKYPLRVYIGTFGKVTPAAVLERSINVFDSSREPILIYNRKEGRLLVNRGFEEFSGYGKDELLGRSPEHFEKPGRSYFTRYMESLPEGGHLVYNTVLVTKTGKERYCEVSLDHIKFNGKSAFIAIYSDLTNFMKLIDEAETLIQLSWEIGNLTSVTHLVEAAADRVFSILKVPFLAIALCDEEGDAIERYCVKMAEGHQWLEPGSTAFNNCLYPLLAESMKEKKTVYRAVEKVFSHCEVRDLAARDAKGIAVVSPLIVSGCVVGCIVVLQEETASFTLHGIRLLELSTNVIAAGIYKLRLEMELRKSLETLEARVQERTKELEDFIYTVSHDLKSPLHAAQGFADMIRKQFASQVKDSEDEYILRRIRENVDQAVMMINDLLELSRIGTRELKFEAVDLNSIIREYTMQFNALNKENIHLGIKIGTKLPPISADAGRMVQLLTNLFNNSIKYRTSDEVKIVIESEVKDGRLKLLIGDNGKGIDEKDLENVFKIFYRGRDAVERQIEGSGLGLTIVKKIAQQHGGSVDIKSKLNAGTTVIIELPLSHVDEES